MYSSSNHSYCNIIGKSAMYSQSLLIINFLYLNFWHKYNICENPKKNRYKYIIYVKIEKIYRWNRNYVK